MRIILQGIFYLPRHILVVVAIYNDWSSGGAVAVEQNIIIICVGYDASTGGVAGSLLHWRSGSTPEGSGKEKMY